MNLRAQDRNVIQEHSAFVETSLVSTVREQPEETMAMLSYSSRQLEADIPPVLPEVPVVTETGSPEAPIPATAAPANPEIGTPEVPPGLPEPAAEISGTATEVPEVVATQPTDALGTKAPANLSPGTPLKNKNDSPSCNTLSCQGLAALNEHPLLYILIFLAFSCMCCLRCKRRRPARDPRGEYRAVGRMLETNFDTELTEEDMNFYASDEDDDDPTIGSNAYTNNYIKSKGSIELGSVAEDEINGGLTLEEMNG